MGYVGTSPVLYGALELDSDKSCFSRYLALLGFRSGGACCKPAETGGAEGEPRGDC